MTDFNRWLTDYEVEGFSTTRAPDISDDDVPAWYEADGIVTDLSELAVQDNMFRWALLELRNNPSLTCIDLDRERLLSYIED